LPCDTPHRFNLGWSGGLSLVGALEGENAHGLLPLGSQSEGLALVPATEEANLLVQRRPRTVGADADVGH